MTENKNYERFENPFPKLKVEVKPEDVQNRQSKQGKVDPTVYQEQVALNGNVYQSASAMTDSLYN